MTNPWLRWWTDPVELFHQATFPRLLLASCLGALIGAERQWRQRAAGLRTNTLVCLGSAAFVDLATTVSPGSVQVIAYVVSGVGFLGAGAIMKDGASIRGLNTAATLWCSAAVGACVGAGEMLDAVFVTILLIAINMLLRPLSRYIDRRSLAAFQVRTLYRLNIVCLAKHQADTELQLTHAASSRSFTLRQIHTGRLEGSHNSILQAMLESNNRDASQLKTFIEELRAYSWVESVECIEVDAEAEA